MPKAKVRLSDLFGLWSQKFSRWLTDRDIPWFVTDIRVARARWYLIGGDYGGGPYDIYFVGSDGLPFGEALGEIG